MRSRRLACLLLGMWLAGGMFMAWVATENFRSVERLLDTPNPAAALQYRALGQTGLRLLLRYQVSEQNRFYFETWETVQIIFGLGFFFFLLFGTREGKFTLLLALLMIAIVAVQRLALTPEITSIGRNMDFVPADVRSPDRGKFWVLHNAYTALELAKWGIGAALGIVLILAGRKGTSGVREELNLINKADYRHIDR